MEENVEWSALTGHAAKVTGIAFSRDDQLLASVCPQQLIVWDVRAGARRYSFQNRYGARLAPVMSPDGQLFAWQTGASTLGLWHTETGLQHSTINKSPHMIFEGSMVFSPDSRTFAWMTEGGIISVSGVNKLSTGATSSRRTQEVATVNFSSDGQRLITSNLDNKIRIWDVMDQSYYCELTSSDQIKELAISHNGLRVAAAVGDTGVEVVNIPRRGRSFVVETSHPCTALTFSADSQLLAICSRGGVELHEMDTPSRVATFPGDRKGARAAAISRDGRFLAAAMADRTHVWDVRGHDLCEKLRLHGAGAVAFSPDGRLIAGYTSSRLELWHVASAACVSVLRLPTLYKELELPGPKVEPLNFSSDGRRLINARGSLAVCSEPEDSTAPQSNALAEFYIRGSWINYASQDILWLPPDYRPPRSSMHDNTFAWCGANGDVDFIKFDTSKIPQAGPGATVEPGCYTWKKPPGNLVDKWKSIFRTKH